MNGLASCAFCGRTCDSREVWSKVWTHQGKVIVPWCSKECQSAGSSYLDEKVSEIRV